MKAAAFDYAKPATLGETLELLARPGAKILAGGQSLIPSLNMRLSSPELLVDITGLSELKGFSLKDGNLSIGALTTHSDIEKSSDVKTHVPLLAEAAPHIAHPAIRNRGTIGGSLALADPAAEYPACAVALNATLSVESKKGKRQIPADKFFKGLFETDLKPDEILTAVRFPAARKGDRSVFLELARRHGDYATVGLAAFNSRFVFFATGSKPEVIEGESLQKTKDLLTKNLKPAADLYHSSETKRHLAGVLLERAWTTLSTSR